MRTTRRSVSVSAETYAKIAEYSRTNNIPMAQLAEQLIQAMLRGEVPVAPSVPSTQLAVASRERRGQISPDRRRASAERLQRRAALRAKLKLERDLALLARADAIRMRVAVAAAPLVKPVRQFPEGAFCGVCAEDCTGQLYQEPIGRNEAMVNVCARCRSEGGA